MKLFTFLMCSLFWSAATPMNQAILKQKTILTIKIHGIKKVQGQVRLGVFKNEDDFDANTNSVANEIVQVNKTEFLVHFELPYGEYAIKVHHDVNSNNKMDTNFVGIPKEPYGFSNDARGTFGPPSYKDCVFTFSQPKDTFKIKVK